MLKGFYCPDGEKVNKEDCLKENNWEKHEEERNRGSKRMVSTHLRYLPASKITLPSRAPLFVESGLCQWCNKVLTGRARFYCSPKNIWEKEQGASNCAISFLNWWCSRPAYVRATFIKDNFTCQNCGFQPMREDKPWLPDISKLEADHIVPMAKGGLTEISNLQTLCRDCNRRKGIKVAVPEKAEQLTLFIQLSTKPTTKPNRKGGYGCQRKGNKK